MIHALIDTQFYLPAKLGRFLLVLALACIACLAVVQAQTAQPTPRIIAGVNETDVILVGESVEVQGTVQQGVLALGGDIVVKGRVEGDVGTVGGNVTLRPGAHVGGDIMVLGGNYYSEGLPAGHRNGRAALVFASYETELRNLVLNPVSLLQPHWSTAYLGQRLLAILFWFVVSWLLAAVSPGAVSRAVERLRLSGPRVALIGLLGGFLAVTGAVLSVRYLPGAIGAVLAAMTLVLLLVAYVFGRVVLHAATGRWLQRVLRPNGSRSEAEALLLGVAVWTLLLSLPFIWPLLVSGLILTSLGLALTARYRLKWQQSATS